MTRLATAFFITVALISAPGLVWACDPGSPVRTLASATELLQALDPDPHVRAIVDFLVAAEQAKLVLAAAEAGDEDARRQVQELELALAPFAGVADALRSSGPEAAARQFLAVGGAAHLKPLKMATDTICETGGGDAFNGLGGEGGAGGNGAIAAPNQMPGSVGGVFGIQIFGADNSEAVRQSVQVSMVITVLGCLIGGGGVVGRLAARWWALRYSRRTCLFSASMTEGAVTVDGSVTILGLRGCRFVPENDAALARLTALGKDNAFTLSVAGARIAAETSFFDGDFAALYFLAKLSVEEQEAILKRSAVTPKPIQLSSGRRKWERALGVTYLRRALAGGQRGTW